MSVRVFVRVVLRRDSLGLFKKNLRQIIRQSRIKMDHSTKTSVTPMFSVQDFDVIGFDVDHTLAKYCIPQLFDAVHNDLANYLVKNKGYDESLLKPFSLHKDFCVRGLIFDIKHGNFLKLAEDGKILRASHGSTFLTDEQIKQVYGETKHWAPTDKFVQHVDKIEGEFMIFENFFDMIGVVVLAQAVDLMSSQKDESKKDFTKLWKDMQGAFTHTYHPTAFKGKTKGFFPSINADPSRFLNVCPDKLRHWLKQLKADNRVLFLMTSSYADFATHTLNYILGDDWSSLFDICLTHAKKPSFFYEQRPFLIVENDEEGNAVKSLEDGKIYSQGNSHALMEYLQRKTNKTSPKVLYVGDSLRSDIFPAKNYTDWSTLMVLEEIVAEQVALKTDEDEHVHKRQKLSELAPSEKEMEYISSKPWGSLFTDETRETSSGNTVETGNVGPKEMNTLWGYIIRKYADVAVPLLSDIAELPLDHKFESFNHEETHQFGFYPRLPDALK